MPFKPGPPPATPFSEGYRRSPEMTTKLVAAIAAALHTFPEQRLGQIIANAVRGCDLFGLYDEDLVDRLHDEIRSYGQQR